MQQYVLGFGFDHFNRVALIRKSKPEWQAGKWSGIGGKVESGESINQAMVREFREETGVEILVKDWSLVGTMSDARTWVVHVFTASCPEVAYVRTREEEHVDLFPLHKIPPNTIANVPALIALCTIPPEPPSNVKPGFELWYGL